MGTCSGGTFDFDIGWISYRGPFDRNEIVVSNIIFRNPPEYNKTPFLLHVKEVCIAVDMISVFSLITGGLKDPLVVDHVVVQGVELFLEKVSDEGASELNLTAALGARNRKKEREMIEFVVNAIIELAKEGIAEKIKADYPDNPIFTSLLPYLVSPLPPPPPPPVAHSHDSTHSSKSISSYGSADSADGLSSEIDAVAAGGGKGSGKGGGSGKGSGKGVVGEVGSGHDSRAGWSPDEHTPLAATSDPTFAKAEPHPTPAGPTGPPFRLDLGRVLIMDVAAHVLDLLSATHQDNSSGTIVIKALNITRNDLTDAPATPGGHRVVLPWDCMAERFGEMFAKELVATNFVSILALAGTAVGNTNTILEYFFHIQSRTAPTPGASTAGQGSSSEN